MVFLGGEQGGKFASEADNLVSYLNPLADNRILLVDNHYLQIFVYHSCKNPFQVLGFFRWWGWFRYLLWGLIPFKNRAVTGLWCIFFWLETVVSEIFFLAH